MTRELENSIHTDNNTQQIPFTSSIRSYTVEKKLSMWGPNRDQEFSRCVEKIQHCAGRGILYLNQIGKYVGICGPHWEDFPYLHQIGTPPSFGPHREYVSVISTLVPICILLSRARETLLSKFQEVSDTSRNCQTLSNTIRKCRSS